MELQVDRRASPEPMSKRAINRSESSARLSRLSGLSGLWVLPRLASIADAKSCTHGRGVQHGCKEMMIRESALLAAAQKTAGRCKNRVWEMRKHATTHLKAVPRGKRRCSDQRVASGLGRATV